MNLTPLENAYQIHHGNPTMYKTNQILGYNPKCIYCSETNSIALMEKHDGGAFRQCGNQSCRKQFNSKQFNNTQYVDNKTFIYQNQSTINNTNASINPNYKNQYLPSEPNFITKFNTNTNANTNTNTNF